MSYQQTLVQHVRSLQFLLRTRLWAQIIVGLIGGIGLGLFLSPGGGAAVPPHTADLIGAWVALPGYVFLALIQMIVIPLVISSIILGINGTQSPSDLKRIGWRAGLYFVCTTILAVSIGLAWSVMLKPGEAMVIDGMLMSAPVSSSERPNTTPSPPLESENDAQTSEDTDHLALPKRIAEIVPSNPLRAALDGSMFQIVVFSIFLGVALVGIRADRARVVLDFASAFQELSMKIVGWAMVIAPLAVFGLLTEITIQLGWEALVATSYYVGTVLLGLLSLVLLYALIVRVIAGRSPWVFLRSIRSVQLLAFSTSSSAAVMPLSIETAREELGIRDNVSNFIIPLGATVNMDGTALYQVTAALFLTQAFGIDLSTGDMVLLIATTVGASIGAPSTPGVGIVILATVLERFGVPAVGIALILGVDRILDMTRTAVNVTGDLAACAVIDKWTAPPNPLENASR